MNLPWYWQIWTEGDYLDLWSLNHFLGYLMLAGVLKWRKINYWPALALAIILMVSWEAYELMIGVDEKFQNILLDIFIGLAGFFSGGSLIKHARFNKRIFFIILAVIVFGLNLWGYAYYRMTR